MASAREEPEAPTGQVTPPRGSASGSGVKGTVAWPFDGGALTLGWTHALAKGRVAAPPLPSAAMAVRSLRSLSTLRGLERKRGRREMMLGLRGRQPRAGFDPATSTLGRWMKADASDCWGQRPAQADARGHAALPAQAQVAAWVRAARVQGRQAGPISWSGRRNSVDLSPFFLLFFQ